MVYYIKLKAVLCWNQDPKVKVKNEADRVLVCQRKAHTHVLPDIWRRERRGGWGRRVHVWTLSCLRGRMTESASPHPSNLSVSIFSAASSSPRLPTFYFLPPPPASCISLISLFSLHLTPSFPSGYSPHLSLSLSLPPLTCHNPIFFIRSLSLFLIPLFFLPL